MVEPNQPSGATDVRWEPLPFTFRGSESEFIEVVERCIHGLPGSRQVDLSFSCRAAVPIHIRQTAAHIEEYDRLLHCPLENKVASVRFTRVVWLQSGRRTYLAPSNQTGLLRIDYPSATISLPTPPPDFVPHDLHERMFSIVCDSPTVKILRSAGGHLAGTIEAVPNIAFACKALAEAIQHWNREQDHMNQPQHGISTPLSSRYDSDFDLLTEVLDTLPSTPTHRDAKWIIRHTVKDRSYLVLSVYELAPQGRKIIRGEIAAHMTLAGLSLSFTDRGNGSTIGMEAWRMLNEEMRIALGIESANDGPGIVAPGPSLGAGRIVPTPPNVQTVPKITGEQFKIVHDALAAAFSLDELKKLTRVHLDQNLDLIARTGNLSAVIQDLIEWVERNHRLADLLQGALIENPANPELLKALRTVGIKS
jgi:hypothetical protein